MISRIRGKLISAQPECIIDVGGVGFAVMIPERDRERLSPTDAENTVYLGNISGYQRRGWYAPAFLRRCYHDYLVDTSNSRRDGCHQHG